MNENRMDTPHNEAPVTPPTKDMTQRVSLEETAQPRPRPANPQRRQQKRWYMTKKEKITLIISGSTPMQIHAIWLVELSDSSTVKWRQKEMFDLLHGNCTLQRLMTKQRIL